MPGTTDKMPTYALRLDTLAADLATDLSTGLTSAEARQRASTVGFNELAAAPPIPAWRRFLSQFFELVVGLLIAAGVISAALGDWPDALAIAAIVLLNGVLGFMQEERAENSLAALQKMSTPHAKVRRDGGLVELPIRQLVAGDVIELEAGDQVPADARLIRAHRLEVQEAALTGESTSVSKDADIVLGLDTPLAERRNMLYMGTAVAAGNALAVVSATGMNTELGHIAGMLQTQKGEVTPLQKRLAELGRILIILCLLIVGVIFVLQITRGQPPHEVLMLAVGLAVAAVPEGLPAVVTVTLSLGVQRMVRRHALIRKLPSVETLGCVTVICSDKTGTLTRNEMTVREIAVANQAYEVTGAGYQPTGSFIDSSGNAVDPADDTATDLRRLLEAGTWCNHARLSKAENGNWQMIGDPTEGAIVVAAQKAGIVAGELAGKVVFELPFDSQRKAMSVVLRKPSGKDVAFVKGAPEGILEQCSSMLHGNAVKNMEDSDRQRLRTAGATMASRALRVLAIAERQLGPPESEWDESLESELTFLGLVGMIDPPREEVKDSVKTCRTAGIRPVMITGDHPATARAIASELRIASENDRVVTGQELDQLSDDQLANDVTQIAVYARVTAAHKLRVVEAWQRRGQVVAMTGDGVNDAPAVKASDIGIAMGVTGTDVTKQASDIVLTDDNFASIVSAVEEGRGVYDNIQKVILYLLASNASEVLLMFFAALIGWPAPLTAIQMLWINLVTDGLPALALTMEKPEPDIMQRPPRDSREPVITRQRGLQIVVHGLIMTCMAAAGFWYFYRGDINELPRARTAAFCILAYSQLFYSLSCRSQRYTMPELGLFSNPYLFAAIAISSLVQFAVVAVPFSHPIVESGSQPGMGWIVVLLLSLAPVTLIEVAKLVRKAVFRSGTTAVVGR
jgi:Ca2+-transporting ATPase